MSSATDSRGFFAARTAVVGHRGNPARHPENTLAGVVSGLADVGRVEVDVRLTADGRLILSHDPVRRGRVIADSTWSDLSHPPLLDSPPGPVPVTSSPRSTGRTWI